MATTRWIDKKTIDLNSAIDLLVDQVAPDDKSGAICWEDWETNKAFDQNQQIKLNARNITYNMVKYSFSQISAGETPIEDRSVPKSGFIIVYKGDKPGDSINYIIDENSSAQKIIRRLMSYNGKSEVERNGFELSSDFFVWLISRAYKRNGLIETAREDGSHYQLDAIKGFRGDSEDLQTTVSVTGESVINIISTLAFLLESNNLKQIQVDLSCTEHENINLRLQRKTIQVDMENYQGKYESDGENEKNC